MFFSYFQPPCLCPSEGHKYGVSILTSINLCGTLCQITRVRNTAQTWRLDRVLIYLSSITCQFLDFIQWIVFDFYFDGVTVKTSNRTSVLPSVYLSKREVGVSRFFVFFAQLLSKTVLRVIFVFRLQYSLLSRLFYISGRAAEETSFQFALL